MSAAHVRRGGGNRAKPRKAAPRVVPKRIAKRLPVDHARANRLAGLTFLAFLLAIGVVALVALDIPAKAQRSAGTAVGRAGFVVSGYQIVGLNHLDRARIDEVVNDELHRAAQEAGTAKAPQPLVANEVVGMEAVEKFADAGICIHSVRSKSAIQAARPDAIPSAATVHATLPNNRLPRLEASPVALVVLLSIRPRLGASESRLIP